MAQQYPSLGFTYRYHTPLADMADAYYQPNSGWGMNLLTPDLFYRKNLPVSVQLGADFSFDYGDKVKLTQEFGDPFFAEGERIIRNKVAGIHGELRLTSNLPGPFQLFAQGLLGTQRFASSETIEIPMERQEDYCEHNNIDRMYTLSYGAGAGFRWEFGQEGAAIEVGATYLWGRNGRSLNVDGIESGETPIEAFQFTDFANPQRYAVRAGISFPVDGDCSPSRSEFDGCCSGPAPVYNTVAQ